MIEVLWGGVMMVVGILLIINGFRDELDKQGYVKKVDVVEAFKATDWSAQRFNSDGVPIKDLHDHDTFYATEEIDAAVKRLNKVLNP